MTFDSLVSTFGSQAAFSRSDLSLMFNESDASIATAMLRLKNARKIFELKRGLYVFSDKWRKATLHGPLAANIIYSPSYLTGLWALSWFGIIPEKTELFTSATTRPTRNFVNVMGRFSYRTLKPSLFNGWEKQTIAGAQVLIAVPEKALADHFYLESGEWDMERMESMRFDPAGIDQKRLADYLEATGETRLVRAMGSWRKYSAEWAQGMVEV